MSPKLAWETKYSVHSTMIDAQHQAMFATINKLIDLLASVPTKEQVNEIMAALVAYKKFHFQTEEKLFAEYQWEGAAEHIAKHREFTVALDAMVQKFGDDSMGLAFALIDYLEDWLLNHILVEDQKYVACFQEHGVK